MTTLFDIDSTDDSKENELFKVFNKSKQSSRLKEETTNIYTSASQIAYRILDPLFCSPHDVAI